MNVIHNTYGHNGEQSHETTLRNLFTNTVHGSRHQEPEEVTADLLANLTSLLVEKGVITLNEVADEVLLLENDNPDRPALVASKK